MSRSALVLALAGVGGCNGLLGWDDLHLAGAPPVDETTDADAPSGDAGPSKGKEKDGGPLQQNDAGGPAAGFCDGTVLCLRFDGADPSGVNALKGTGTVKATNGDAISAPAALRSSAQSTDYAAQQWGVTGTFGPTSVITFRMNLKVLTIGTVTGLPTVGQIRIGGTMLLNIAVKTTTNQIFLIWTDLSGKEIIRANIAKYAVGEWTLVSFAILSNGGLASAPETPALDTPPSAPSGDVAVSLGIPAYYASDSTPFANLIDDVAVTLK